MRRSTKPSGPERGHSCPMPLGFQCRHPGGMAENSPAFQRWDLDPGVPSPEGTAEGHQFSRPFRTQPSIRPHPALKRRAIFKSPSGTKTRPPCGTYSSNPSGIGQLVPLAALAGRRPSRTALLGTWNLKLDATLRAPFKDEGGSDIPGRRPFDIARFALSLIVFRGWIP